MGAVYHDTVVDAGLLQGCYRFFYMLFIKVRPQGGTAQNQVAGLIARSGNNGGNSLLCLLYTSLVIEYFKT